VGWAALAPTALVDDIVPSPIRYTTCPDGVAIAYQTAGAGTDGILVIPGFVHHLDIWWNAPTDRLVRSLASIGRLIMFDKRGMGLSDRPDHIVADDWVTDALAVLDAVEVDRVVVLGVACGAQAALQLAHRHPERVSGLAIFGGYACSRRRDDNPSDQARDQAVAFVERLIAGWGTGTEFSTFAPSRAGDEVAHAYWTRYQQLSASPPAARRFLQAMLDSDVRATVPEVNVPTVVIHPTRDAVVSIDRGRWIAEHLPHARVRDVGRVDVRCAAGPFA
jgi:pimeloyl-ACP methyl ester carboxylesterase